MIQIYGEIYGFMIQIYGESHVYKILKLISTKYT